MRTTDFCFPLPDYEHPCLVSYRHLFETYASPLADRLAPVTRRPVDLAFHDAESASAGPAGLARGIILPALPIEPYLWHLRHSRSSSAELSLRAVLPGCRGRFLRPSVKMRRSVRPEGPFTAGGHSRAYVNRVPSRSRSRVLPRRQGPRCPFARGSRSFAFAPPKITAR